MSDKVFGPLVAGDEIGKERRSRSLPFEKKTIKASTTKLVMEKVAIEEKEGWERGRRNKKSYTVTRDKPLDEQLEDQVWCIVEKMGFTELSKGRKFCIETKRDPNPRQIDVFAKDDEAALVIECTQRKTPTPSSQAGINNLIEKISDFKDRISKAIAEHYGREALVKPKFIIATRNIGWGDADKEKCREENICIIADEELDYYNALTTHLKTAARFQFLAHVFEHADIPGLSKQVPATMGLMGDVKFYNFLIEPNDLLKISYIAHKGSRSVDDLYQRMPNRSRLKAISKFIDDGGKFPTNIVINIKNPKKKPLVFEPQSPKDGVSTGSLKLGSLKLPARYGSAWVIDGQHRLYGHAYRDTEGRPKEDKSILPVLAFENLPAKNEMDMFIEINSKQVKVKTSLLLELYADLHWNSDSPAEQLLALQAKIVNQLNNMKTSPLSNRVVVTGKKKDQYRCLTATSLSDGIAQSRLLGSVKKYDQLSPGPLSNDDPRDLKKSLTRATNVFSGVLGMFASAMPEHWESGDKKGVGYLCTNIGVRSIILVVMDICSHLGKESEGDLSTWPENKILDEVKKYIQPVVDYFTAAEPDQIQSFRRQGSSLDSVRKQSMGMNIFIQGKFPKYSPNGLDEYVSNRDQKGNDEALLMVDRIQSRIFQHVVEELKANFGEAEDEWWVKGIPGNIRIECSEKWEKEDRAKPQESYLYLINYREIARHNWNLFEASFALGEKDTGNPKKCVAWIKELNDIRNKTHHPEKGKLTPEELKSVEEIWNKVNEYFPASGE